MTSVPQPAGITAASAARRRAVRQSATFAALATGVSLAAALLLPQSYLLRTIGDMMQVGLVALATWLAIENCLHCDDSSRDFWLLISIGSSIWLVSLALWTYYEIILRQDVPDIPVADLLLVLKLVPLTAAIAVAPYRRGVASLRAFGKLDVSILMVYALYLYAFWVYAYRLMPGASEVYLYHFNLADALGNQVFVIMVAIAAFRAEGAWRMLLRVYFISAACYAMASDISNVAIDLNRYYSGSLFDVPLTLALAGFASFVWIGRTTTKELEPGIAQDDHAEVKTQRPDPIASNLAMLVTLSTPLIGFWLLTRGIASPQIFPFRLIATLATIFLLTLLLALKQHLLAESLIGNLRSLSDTYTRIDRFKDQLTQSEKLASLGQLVAHVANQIKDAMAVIRKQSFRLTSRPDSESRIQSMAGKIGQYAHRTDSLVENMLRFAQETPLQFTSVEIGPLLESALHLSRISKFPNIQVDLVQESAAPPVRGDSSQLLHVFLQIISNAIDSIEQAGGGVLRIVQDTSGSQLRIQFADSGTGVQAPDRVFEPFYTTKPVGKGMGLGLSTCYGILKQHNGTIDCRNRAEGGALFTVHLPLACRALSVAAENSTPSIQEVM